MKSMLKRAEERGGVEFPVIGPARLDEPILGRFARAVLAGLWQWQEGTTTWRIHAHCGDGGLGVKILKIVKGQKWPSTHARVEFGEELSLSRAAAALAAIPQCQGIEAEILSYLKRQAEENGHSVVA